MLNPIKDMPAVADDSYCDYQFLYGAGDEQEPHLLVYEIPRDFLSAPRTFAIVRIIILDSDAIELNSDNEYDGVEYGESGNMQEIGLFSLEPSEWEYGRDQTHLLISLPEQRIELLCHRIELTTSVIARSARHALLSYMEQT